ncbi:hydantoinase/oxoprolinase family protein [Variovorax paradoxus]|uniref:hydantoinase/oxoprolinase family protein n=1 Tax=Variovorax paradoxus TaxID=34073 RepID=UPI001931779B|nr:hydantoinase/oxoprolinase family protein [Variovorax paradoxus]
MRIAVDTGGTFTDLIVEDDAGNLRMHKASTTPGRPLEGVGAALRLAAEAMHIGVGDLLARTQMFIYGTTHALNAVVTGRTARTAFLTTFGHPDILVLREGGRADPFDYGLSTPDPYIARSLTWEVPERLLADGSIRTPLDESGMREIASSLRAARVEAVAVCLLWANVNPCHERRVRDLLAEELPGIPVSLSSDVSPSIREYRRASATAIDASLKPAMHAHLLGLQDFLKESGLAGRMLVITSRGGLIDAEAAAQMPIQMLNSGPAMAPVSGRFFASADCSNDFAIVADTGGTTYDVSLVRRGHIPLSRDTQIDSPTGRHITGFPSIDIRSVGAGGGSIAWVDAGGLLHVGPQSAGADPGPAAYGRGAGHATLTDACLVLGYLDPRYFLGGLRSLDLGASREAIERNVARPLGRTLEEAAVAIVQIATENMVQAIEDITVNQGVDPSKAVLVGGGGAAGLNSAWIAQRLGVQELLIPEMGPALSACGALMSELSTQHRRTWFTRSDRFDLQGASRVLADLQAQCASFFELAGKAGSVQLSVEARYPDQVWEIDVQLPMQTLGCAQDVRAIEAAFHSAHEEVFGIHDLTSPIEIVGWTATASVRLHDTLKFMASPPASDTSTATRRTAYFPKVGLLEVPIHRLESLPSTRTFDGPAIVESAFTTVVVPPGNAIRRTMTGSLIITQC